MFVLNRDSGVPLPAQLAAHIRSLIADGTMRAGDGVPSSRQLARDLQVSRGTVVAAYDQLIAEGYLVTRPGGTTKVHPGAVDMRPWVAAPAAQVGGIAAADSSGRSAVAAPARLRGTDARPLEGPTDARSLAPRPGVDPARAERVADLAALSATAGAPVIDLRPGFSHEEVATDSMWREAWRAAAGSPPEATDGRGLAAARTAISEHLRLTRAMSIDPADIVVTGGAREGLFTLLSCMSELGLRRCLAVENPGYPGLRGVIRRAGVEVVDIGARLPVHAGAALVTPNRVYPLGGSMPAPARMELLRAAEENGTLIIEDDLDSQYRHVGPLMPTLWELAPQAVAHLGTFNHVLTRSARLGYLILSRNLQDPVLAFRRDLGMIPSDIAQRALATYLDHGGLRRYLARRRRDVARRKEIVGSLLDWADLRMHAEATAIVRLAQETADAVVVDCARNGVLVDSLSTYWSGGAETGIVFSYGRGSVGSVREAVARIGAAIGDLSDDGALDEFSRR